MMQTTLLAVSISLLVGCVGTPEDAETSADAEKVGGYWIVGAGPFAPWPADQSSVTGGISVTTGDCTGLGAPAGAQGPCLRSTGTRHVFTLDPAAALELSVDNAPDAWMQRKLSTVLSVTFYHRPAGSRVRWEQVSGGPNYVDDLQPLNWEKLANFQTPVRVDLRSRWIQFSLDRGGDFDHPSAAAMTEILFFDNIGITEPNPEIAVLVTPTYDFAWINETYRYQLAYRCKTHDRWGNELAACRNLDMDTQRASDESGAPTPPAPAR